MKAGFLAVTLLAVACGVSSQSPSASTPPWVQAVIGSKGGTLVAPDGSAVSIPPGALLEDTVITMSPASEPPGDLGIGEPAGPMWLFGGEGQQFRLPVTVTLAFDASMLDPYETPDDVLVYTSPKATPTFSVMPTSLVDASHVSTQTTHFSLYGARHHTRMFGLGYDAAPSSTTAPGPSATGNAPLFAELKSGWKSKEGHSLKSARMVFNIDVVDDNTDNGNLKLLAEANAMDAKAWATAAKNGLASLATWAAGVESAGLMPVVAISVSYFDACREDTATKNRSCPKNEKSKWTSLDHDKFQERFKWLLQDEKLQGVRAWGLINEPDVQNFDVKDAVEYYVDAATVLSARQAKKDSLGVSLFVGEFAFNTVKDSKEYWGRFGAQMIESVKAAKVGFPRYWGMHPYKDTTGTKDGSSVRFDTDGTSAYVDFIEGLESQANQPKDSLRIWLTETGAMLEWNIGNCADSRNNQAQYDGAKQIYALAAKSRVDRVYWWQFVQATCDWGGAWDSSMVDWNGLPRPAFYALTQKPDAYPGVSVSRDCGGPGKNFAGSKTEPAKNDCGGVFGGGSLSASGQWTGADEGGSACCVLCSKQSQTFSTYAPAAGLTNTCAGSALAFCGASEERGSVQNAMPGYCSPLPGASAPPSCGALASGQSIVDAGEVRSCNGTYWLTLGTDGKLIETQLDVGQVWSVGGAAGDQLDMQADGNLVLYSSTGAVLWASDTSGSPGAYLDVGNDGSLVITTGTAVCSLRGKDGSIPACP
jgi:hypothetical protein